MPSSVIRSMRYNPAERTLYIEFRDGRGVYRYFDVPAAEWKAFRAAPSKGTYLNQTFKEAGYGYEKIVAPARTAPQESLPQDALLQDALPQGGEFVWGDDSKVLS